RRTAAKRTMADVRNSARSATDTSTDAAADWDSSSTRPTSDHVMVTFRTLTLLQTRTSLAIDPCIENRGGCHHHCVNDNGRARCQCYPGFKLDRDQKTCVDIDECRGLSGGGCQHECVNVDGSYKYLPDSRMCKKALLTCRCQCHPGYELAEDGRSCHPRTENCQVHNGGCQHACLEQPDGRIRCVCREGFALDGDGKTCHDIDECEKSNAGCDQLCINVPGSFECSCNPGFLLIYDRKTCEDVNECVNDNAGCEQGCTNRNGTYECTCDKGYELAEDRHSCHDINECLENNGGCSQLCRNEAGGYRCECFSGYVIDTTGKSCI
ncbi:Calcium binding EGF domain containing protein, partial [Aphelenchoides avenae]